MSLDLIVQTLFLFLFCLVLAFLEAQIEGEAGWAANLPTWKPSRSSWYARFYQKVMSGKDLTGYHMLIFTLVLVFLHYPYFTYQAWSFTSELTTLSFFFLVAIIWDFLWFVVNPRYDFGHFWAERVWWHKKWALHIPIEYWFGLVISALLYSRFSLALFKEWLTIIALFFVLILVVVIFANAVGIFRIRPKS